MLLISDIQEEFDRTNKAYLDELELELGDDIENYNSILKTEKEIDEEIAEIKNSYLVMILKMLKILQSK